MKKKRKKNIIRNQELVEEGLISKSVLGSLVWLSSFIKEPSPNIKYQINYSPDEDEISYVYKKYSQQDIFYKLAKVSNIKEKIKINDGRLKGTGTFTGYYPKWIIHEIVKNSLKYDVDPYLAISIALAESGIGKGGITNVFQNSSFNEDDEEKFIEYAKKHLNDEEQSLFEELMEIDRETFDQVLMIYKIKYNINVSVKLLSQKMKVGKEFVRKNSDKIEEELEDAFIIQAYNGYGKLETLGNEYYKEYMLSQVAPEVIDMSKTPYYGIKIIDLMNNAVVTNSDIQNIVSYWESRKK